MNQPVQWARPQAREQERDTLRIRVDIYEETITLRRYGEDANWIRTVDARDIIQAFAQEQEVRSPLLPPNALCWKRTQLGEACAVWEPPGTWQVGLQDEPFQEPERMELPMPGLVFIKSTGRNPMVFAAPQRPEHMEETLFHAPAYNVFNDGRICPGSHRFPEETALIPASFFESHFSRTGDHQGRSVRHPRDLMGLWEEIRGSKQYPNQDLVPWGTLQQAMDRA